MFLNHYLFLFFMVLGVTSNYHSISLSLAVFKYLNLIAFGTWTILSNKLHPHRVSFKWFQLNKVPIKPKQTFVQERSVTFIVTGPTWTPPSEGMLRVPTSLCLTTNFNQNIEEVHEAALVLFQAIPMVIFHPDAP